ncbi:MAG: hypothetical protein ABJA35_16545 [Parafilimonas sp.]
MMQLKQHPNHKIYLQTLKRMTPDSDCRKPSSFNQLQKIYSCTIIISVV